jgi:hypothetical protein
MKLWSGLPSRLRAALQRRSHHVALVQATAQAMIGRPLDLAQASEMASRIAHRPAEMQAVVEEMLHADEARRHAAPALLLDAPALAAPSCFISLGTHCFTASLLQRWGLRSWSGPFDWLFASPGMLAHAFGDDFRSLLDRSQYRPVPPEQRVDGPDVNRVDHAFYRERHGVAFVFNHHDVHLDEGHAYLVRCVERLRAQLSAPTHKTFLLFRRAETTRVEEIVALQRALASRTTNFRLCAFAVVSGPPQVLPQAEVLRTDDTLSLWRYRPCSAWNPLHFESPLDEAAVLRLAASASSAPPLKP